MARARLTIEQAVTLLRATPQRLAALTTDLTPAQLRTAPPVAEWSANDVLAHLRACADVGGAAVSVILAKDHPTLRAVDPRTWIKRTDYRDMEFRPSLHAFAAQRTELMAVRRSLSPEGWSREATVTGGGRTLERTVLSYAEWLARHEGRHIKQVERIVCAMADRTPPAADPRRPS